MAANRHDRRAGTSRKKPGGQWSYSAGERGRNRVRVYDRGSRGMYADYDDNGVRVRTRLGQIGQEKAKQYADDLAAKFRRGEARPTRLTLKSLFEMYEREITQQKGTAGTRQHDRTCAKMMLAFLGADTDPGKLSRTQWDRFIAARRTGIVRPASVKKPRRVGERAIQYDLKYLSAVLNWATVASDGRGGPLLERNPCRGFPLPVERNPKRPVCTDDLYEALTGVANQVHPLVNPLLVLCRETGHRIGSVRQLRWSDVDLDRATVTWQAATDKEGRTHTTPLTLAAVATLQTLRRSTNAPFDGWVFPSPVVPDAPCSRHVVRDWWERIAKLAKVPTGQRIGWHSLRRGFATAMRDASPKELTDLGGWADYSTPLKIYIAPDLDAQRAAFATRRTLRGPITAGVRVAGA